MPSGVSENEIAKLAACLITSSTIERYERCVEASTITRDFVERIDTEARLLMREAWRLWSSILRAPERSESEVTLAALLAALGNSAVEDIERLLIACSIATAPQATWVSALARRILNERSSDATVELVQYDTWDIPAEWNTAGEESLLPAAA